MKKILFITCIVLLQGCAQNTALLGPSYTYIKSGSIVQAGTTLSTSYGIKKATTNSLISFDQSNRECRTIHSSELSKIFFDTLDELDCFKDPFSILR
tara:strand:- start:471 stop:761 length:291 start_codon:yes stop_codon:yes gene_type:complete